MSVTAAVSLPSRLAQYYALTKPRVVQLIVFCALIGMVLAVPGVPTLDQLLRMLVVARQNRLGVAAGIAVDVRNGLLQPLHDADADDWPQVLGTPILLSGIDHISTKNRS